MTERIHPERVLVAVIGLLLFAYGVTGLVFSDVEFGGDPLDGTVNGETWLGAEGNGWTFLSFMLGGVVLFAASATRIAAKTAAVVIGLLCGAASVIALVDGDDVFGSLAANGPTTLIWGVAALLLLAIGLAPTGRGRERDEVTTIDHTEPSEARFRRARSADRVDRLR